jgi:hypothetical protein
LHERCPAIVHFAYALPRTKSERLKVHFKDIERVAMVGETKWQHGMAIFCKPFTTAKVRYFDGPATDQAREWLAAA